MRLLDGLSTTQNPQFITTVTTLPTQYLALYTNLDAIIAITLSVEQTLGQLLSPHRLQSLKDDRVSGVLQI